MSEATAVLPREAQEALKLWDSGGNISAFEVESEGAHQHEIYARAFELIRVAKTNRVGGDVQISFAAAALGPSSLTKRELDVAHSIAYVAVLKGWNAMVAQHLASGHIKAIAIRKEK